MKDAFGREITYLRISLTDRCNLRCKYCMPENGVELKSHSDILSIEDITEIVSVCAGLGISKVRLTGGEPLLRRGILDLCKNISSMDAIKDLAITTNGVLLESMAEDLKNAGVNRLNISLDTALPNRYKSITRVGNISDVLGGISKALSCGFDKIKLNAVLLGGFNTDEIEGLAKITMDYPIDVRFIELMHMPGIFMPDEAYVSNAIVFDKLPELIACERDGVASMFMLPGAKGRIGLISPVSAGFCDSCNKIRLTAEGFIKPCLHSKEEISLKGLHGKDLQEQIINAINAKPKEHKDIGFNTASESLRNMNQIGG